MQIISKGLKFSYNKKAEFKQDALKDITLNVESGDFFGIIGHTGSGKSTFITHLNGLTKVQEGFLQVGNVVLSDISKKDKGLVKELRKQVGIVFQYPEYQLFAETVYLDVAFGLRNFYPNLTEEKEEEMVKEALTLVGIDYERYKDVSPFDLSGGQKRRVALAGVIVSKPKLLVLDEPVAGLDPIGKRNLMNLLHTLHEEVVETIVIVSHDLDEICENCNKIAVFKEGVCEYVSTPSELFSNEKFLEENKLDLPITAKLVKKLKSNGVNLPNKFETEEFINLVEKKLKGIN